MTYEELVMYKFADEKQKRKIIRKYRLKAALKTTLVILSAAISIAFIAIEIYVWIAYGGKPISEIPSWVLFFMFKGN